MADSPRIYADSCCFIDAVKSEVGLLPTDRTKDVWFFKNLLKAHREGDLVLYTSMIAVAECVAVEPGQTDVPSDVQAHFRNLLTSGQYVRLVTPTPRTGEVVQDLRWKHNLVLRGMDATHIATAIEFSCSEFLTSDGQLQKDKIKAAAPALLRQRLRLITPKGTAFLPERFAQPDMMNDQGKP